MGVSHSRLSGMDASAMHSRIGEADAAVTIGGVGLGSEVIQELTARLDSSYLLLAEPKAVSTFYMSRWVLPKSLADVTL
jgi:hypothetical protein